LQIRTVETEPLKAKVTFNNIFFKTKTNTIYPIFQSCPKHALDLFPQKPSLGSHDVEHNLVDGRGARTELARRRRHASTDFQLHLVSVLQTNKIRSISKTLQTRSASQQQLQSDYSRQFGVLKTKKTTTKVFNLALENVDTSLKRPQHTPSIFRKVHRSFEEAVASRFDDELLLTKRSNTFSQRRDVKTKEEKLFVHTLSSFESC
jgi:hypothetical protein